MPDSQDTVSSEPQPSLSNLMVRLWHHLSKRRRRQLGLLVLLMLISAFSEIISLGAVLPFIGVLTAPDRLFKYQIFRNLAEVLGLTSANQLMLPLAIVFAIAALAASAIRLILLWVNTRLSDAIGADLSIEAYRRTLYQPYKVQVARNSSQLISAIDTKTINTLAVIQAFLTILSSVVIFATLIIALLAIDPVAVSVATAVFGICYGLITWVTRRKLRINSQEIATEGTQVVKALQEGLGGIRDVLLNGTQKVYCDTYGKAHVPYLRARGSNYFIQFCPRFGMEATGMVLIAGMAYALSKQTGGLGTALPVLGVLALGAQRLLPILQQIYLGWVVIAGNQHSVAEVIDLLDQPLPPESNDPKPEPLPFRGSISFESVRFRYSEDGPWILNGVDFTIPKGSTVGFVGATGSGKTTTMDLLMGLLDPTEGEILVDGLPINAEHRRSWQQNIAHVPQAIFLADTSLLENIALGIPPESIDMERVRYAARQAQISEFIESLPQSYNAFVGERGIRLSGGQRQRIGMARALYKRATVLVFDEATSSLDNSTEHAVMDAIHNLNSDLTIVLVAHRLTTVQNCDIIFEMANGKIVAQGSYGQLLAQSPSFRNMATAVA